ncbi:hypothetical protein CVT26_004981, partial [Gymnopilus dilepis]
DSAAADLGDQVDHDHDYLCTGSGVKTQSAREEENGSLFMTEVGGLQLEVAFGSLKTGSGSGSGGACTSMIVDGGKEGKVLDREGKEARRGSDVRTREGFMLSQLRLFEAVRIAEGRRFKQRLRFPVAPKTDTRSAKRPRLGRREMDISGIMGSFCQCSWKSESTGSG